MIDHVKKLQNWEHIKILLRSARATCVSDYAHIPEHIDKEFEDYLANNEFELAWEVLYNFQMGLSSFWMQMETAAKLMGLEKRLG